MWCYVCGMYSSVNNYLLEVGVIPPPPREQLWSLSSMMEFISSVGWAPPRAVSIAPHRVDQTGMRSYCLLELCMSAAWLTWNQSTGNSQVSWLLNDDMGDRVEHGSQFCGNVVKIESTLWMIESIIWRDAQTAPERNSLDLPYNLIQVEWTYTLVLYPQL